VYIKVHSEVLQAKVKSISGIQLISSEEALKALLGTIDSDVVKEELNKWFEFGLDTPNSHISNLDTEQLALFMDKISDLMLILYNLRKENNTNK
jgi:hypothetical protein